MAPLSSSFTRRRCCVLVSFGGRPGEKRTFNALAPPLRRRLRQRMTELAAHPISRATAFRLRPASSSVNARWRRFSSRSAEPLGLGMGVPSRYTHYCIIYAVRNNDASKAIDEAKYVADTDLDKYVLHALQMAHIM